MHMQGKLYIIKAFYGAILSAQGNESRIKKEPTTDMSKTTNPVLLHVTPPYIICFCVCGGYTVNETEYTSLKKAQLQRKFPEPAASWLHSELRWGKKYGFHQHPNTSSGPDKEELLLGPEVG